MVSIMEEMAKGFGSYFQRPEALVAVAAAAAAFVLLGVALHSLLSARGREARRVRRDFRGFAAASLLDRAETDLFWRLAVHSRLDDPCLFFVKRTLFEDAAAELGIDPGRCDSLRKKVYGP